MKTNILKLTIIFTALCLGSCNGWLSTQPKGKILLTDVGDYAKTLDFIGTSGMDGTTYNLADIGALNDDQWYSPALVNQHLTAKGVVNCNFVYDTDFDRSVNASSSTGNNPATFYQGCYVKISRVANIILDNLSTMTGRDEDKKVLAAQARMLRAYAYFMLINIYAKPYDPATASTDGGVPIVTSYNIEQRSVAKSSVAQVYAQIEKDITDALPDLPEVAATPFRFTKAGGYGFQARVFLFKKEFDNCIQAALTSYGLNHKLNDLTQTINTTTGLPKTPIYADTDPENIYFASTLLPNPSYYSIGPELIGIYQQFGSRDVRFLMYTYPLPGSDIHNGDILYTATTKFLNLGATAYAFNGCGVRTTEVMLMLAECYARKGDYTNAKTYLFQLMKARILNLVDTEVVIPANVTGAVKYVLNERRKELTIGPWRFFDLRRLNTEPAYRVTLSRLIPADPLQTAYLNIMPQQTYTLPPDSPLYVLPFPKIVLDNNTALISNSTTGDIPRK